MRCPVSDPGFAEHRAHGREAQLPFIRQVVKSCRSTAGIAIDVGAHIGIWSVELAKHFDRVHAFEPVKENYECLLENVARLKVTVHPNVALGEREGYCDMFAPRAGNSGMAYASHDLYEGSGTVETASIHTLDSYRFRNVGLIKIDVEGYEGNVMLGASGTIDESRPVIVFEDNGLGPKRYGRDWIEPKPILLRHGYKQAFRNRKDEVWVPLP